jgi:predicted dinucleotide-binding enzyme
MNIAVIGRGKVCEALAKELALSGHSVFIGTRSEFEYISEELLDVYENICPATIEYAGAIADVIILATPIEEVREAAYLLDDVRDKVIIDLTSFNLTRFGIYTNTLNAIKSITGSPNVVKCFNNTGYEHLIDPKVSETSIDMFMAGDSKKAKQMASLLARDLGFDECKDIGDASTVQQLDEMTMEWHNISIKMRAMRSLPLRIKNR